MSNYNKFKNTQINDVNNLGYALSISGNIKLNNDNVSTIYSNQIYDYNNNYYLTSSNLFNEGTALEAAFNDVAVGGNIQTGNLNCSNDLTSINIKSDNIKCNTLTVNTLNYKYQFVGNLNITSINLSIPLSNGSILDTTTYYTNFNLQPYLINSNNNSVFLNPNYSLIFYNNNTILQIIDNSNGTNILYNTINFNINLVCTSIIIQFKNINI